MTIKARSKIKLLGFITIFLLCLNIGAQAMLSKTLKNVIIDTDMDVDDWMAIAWVLNQSDVNVVAITVCTDGAAISQSGAEFAPFIVELVNKAKKKSTENNKVDVYCGVAPDISSEAFSFPSAIRRLTSNWKSIGGFVDLFKKYNIKGCHYNKDITSSKAIYDKVIDAYKAGTKITIISTGSATNIYEAWKIAQSHKTEIWFKQGIDMIYKGGGAFGLTYKIKGRNLLTISNFNIPGNLSIPGIYSTNNNTTEWNIYISAQSMQGLLDSGLPITFIPLNAENMAPITKDSYNKIEAIKSPLSEFVSLATLNGFINPNGGWSFASELFYWDVVAVISALRPDIIPEDGMFVTKMCVVLKNPTYYVYPERCFRYYAPPNELPYMPYRLFTQILGKYATFYYGTMIVDIDGDCAASGNTAPRQVAVLMSIDPDKFIQIFADGLK